MRTFAIGAAALVALIGFTGTQAQALPLLDDTTATEEEAPAEPSNDTEPSDDTVAALELVTRVNAERASNGLQPVVPRTDITDIARTHSFAMARSGTIFHNDDYFSSSTRQRIGADALGENVALNSTAEGAHERLMNSPGHRANILDPRFNVIGFAAVRGADDRLYITEAFARVPVPAPVPVATTAAPPPPPPPAPAPPPAPSAPPVAPGSPTVTEPAAMPSVGEGETALGLLSQPDQGELTASGSSSAEGATADHGLLDVPAQLGSALVDGITDAERRWKILATALLLAVWAGCVKLRAWSPAQGAQQRNFGHFADLGVSDDSPELADRRGSTQ